MARWLVCCACLVTGLGGCKQHSRLASFHSQEAHAPCQINPPAKSSIHALPHCLPRKPPTPRRCLPPTIHIHTQIVVNVAKEYTEQLTAEKIIELLEAHKSYHGLYFYLGAHIAFSENPEVGGCAGLGWARWWPGGGREVAGGRWPQGSCRD